MIVGPPGYCADPIDIWLSERRKRAAGKSAMLQVLLGFIGGGAAVALAFLASGRLRELARPPVRRDDFVDLVLNSVDAAITVYDAKGRLLNANRGAQRLSGYSEAELRLPETWRNIIPADEWENVSRILNNRNPKDFPIVNMNHWIKRDGEMRYLRWSNVALTDKAGKLSTIVCIGFDVTEQQRFEAELIAARNQAEMASRAKSSFLANMSHELRTPLNAVIGFSQIIRDRLFGDSLDRYIGYANDIHESGTFLLELINGILDMSKLEAGKHELREQPIDIAELFDSSVRLIEHRTKPGGLELVVEIAPDLPKLKGDPQAIKRILVNLLSNAAKFTNAGGRVELTARCGSDSRIEITVSDTGIGIPASAIDQVYQPFYQVENAASRRFEGTGLGLAITKRLVDLHDAEITISSTENIGTSVTVSFPPERSVREKAAGKELAPVAKAGR